MNSTSPKVAYAVSIPETVRAIGVYTIVDGSAYFLPRDVVEYCMVRSVERSDETYVAMRRAVYKACAHAPWWVTTFGDREAEMPIYDRAVRFASLADAKAHWEQLRPVCRSRLAMQIDPRSRVFDELPDDMSIHKLAGWAPSATGLSGIFVGNGVTHELPTASGVAGVLILEAVQAVGTYAVIDDVSYFVPTRIVGELKERSGRSFATDYDHDDGYLHALACAPIVYGERAESQGRLPFSRQIARFASSAALVAHRARIAATFLVPANPALTRHEEAGYHYEGGGEDCDHWRGVAACLN